MKTKVFPLTNVVLYAKGWYEKSEDIFADLIKVLELDDYSPFTKTDVFSILIGRFQELDIRASELREFLISIHPSECWKIGYAVKGSGFNHKDTIEKEYEF